MKKILLIGEKYSSNLGDGIICDTVNDLLLSNNYNLYMMDISGRTQFVEDLNDFNLKKEYIVYFKMFVKKILSIFGYNKMGKNLNRIFNDFKLNFDNLVNNNNFDYIVFVGGQMFIDTFINQIEYICHYAEKNNVGIIFNSCGTGNILNKNSLQNILNSKSVKYISVRDGRDELNKYTNNIINTCCDNAICCSNIYGKENNDTKYSGVGIMFSTLQSPLKQVHFWKKTIKQLIDENVSFKLFTNGSYKDYCFVKYILNSLNLEEKKFLLDQPKEPIELVEQIRKFDKVLSMRLHSMIVSYSYDIPAIAICWDKKVNTFFSKIGLENNCYNLNSNPKDIVKHFISLDSKTIDKKIKKELLNEVSNNIENIKNIMEG